MTIDEKINLKANLFWYAPTPIYEQLTKRNLIALAPYYNERLNRQRAYLEDRERTPQWVKDLERH